MTSPSPYDPAPSPYDPAPSDDPVDEPLVPADYPDTDADSGADRGPDPDAGELDLADRLGTAAREFVGRHPTAPLEATARNLGRWTHLDGLGFARLSARSDGLPPWTGTFAALGTLVLLVLSLAGIGLGALRGTPAWLWLVPVLLVLSVAVTVSAVRYRAPAEPFAVLLAAFALHRMDRVALRRPVA